MGFKLRGWLPGMAALVMSVGAPVMGHAADEAKLAGRVAAAQPVDFDVFLPVTHRAELQTLLDALHDPKSPQFHKWLKPAEFNARFGVQAERLAAIESELGSRGLTVTEVAPRQLHVSGPAAAVEQTFSSELANGVYPKSGKRTVAFRRPFVLPSSILAADGVVAGLSGKIRMHTNVVKLPAASVSQHPDNRYGPTGGYWFTDLKQAYSYPSYQAYSGTGVVIGILMSGDYSAADMVKYFGHEKIAPPKVYEVKIAGGAPFGTDDSVETALDLQQTGGMAPNASLLLYNLPNLSDGNILSGLVSAVESNVVDVLSMSFGGPEKFYSAEYNGGQDYSGILQVFDDLFAQGNAQGITFVASSGDSGALAIPPLACLDDNATSACGSMQPDVSIPASSPHVTAVGGTNLVTVVSPSNPLSSAYVRENADDDPLLDDIFYGTPATGAVWGSGGGNSGYFRKPLYQTLVTTGSRYRTIPDVSLHMGGCPGDTVAPTCPPDRSFDYAVWNNLYYGLIGTSASAPDFAGLLALKIERDGSRQGNANYTLYVDSVEQSLGLLPAKIFRKGIDGYNGYYSTKPGYDRVTGLGSILGLPFLQAPAGTAVAGSPQTPSNP